MDNREEIIKELAPISLKSWEQEKAAMEIEPTFEECISAIAAPSFHSDALSPEKAVLRLYAIKVGLEALLDSCLMVLEEAGANGPKNWEATMEEYIYRIKLVKESFQ